MQFIKQTSQTKLTFADGSTSLVDKNVLNYKNELNKKEEIPGYLPFFSDLNQSIKNYSDTFLDFYNFIISNYKLSNSQLFQDLFVFYNFQELKNGNCLEIGAIEEGKYSNVSLLASHLGWKCFILDRNIPLCENLKNKYPDCEIINSSIHPVHKKGVTSPLLKAEDFLNFQFDVEHYNLNPVKPKLYTPTNEEFLLKEISINEIFKDFFNSSPVEYLSLNLNDQNIKIIEDLDFKNFAPKIITINDYFRKLDSKLDSLLAINGYLRFFKEHTQYEKWYVLQE